MNIIKISIIITLYNRKDLVLSAVNSVINKSPNIEVIVIDDGSTDAPLDNLQEYITNNTIVYYYKKNGGAASAKNYGATKANGKYILFLDSDDYISSIKTLQEIMEKNLDFDLFTHKKIVIKKGTSIKTVSSRDVIINYYDYLIKYPLNYPDKPAYIFRRSKFLSSNGFNESHQWGDALLFWRIYLKNSTVYSFDESSYFYDLSGNNSISRDKKNGYYHKVLHTLHDSYLILQDEIKKNDYTVNWCFILLLLSVRTLSFKKIIYYTFKIIKNRPKKIKSSIAYIIEKRKNRD